MTPTPTRTQPMTTPDTPEQVGWPLNTGVAADAARAATASRPSPSVLGQAGIANAGRWKISLDCVLGCTFGRRADGSFFTTGV